MQVFTVTHTIVRATDDEDDKEIGVFSTEDLAKRAIGRVKDLPGFRDPRGFFKIEKAELDVDHFAQDTSSFRRV
jgi:hypothetical protein